MACTAVGLVKMRALHAIWIVCSRESTSGLRVKCMGWIIVADTPWEANTSTYESSWCSNPPPFSKHTLISQCCACFYHLKAKRHASHTTWPIYPPTSLCYVDKTFELIRSEFSGTLVLEVVEYQCMLQYTEVCVWASTVEITQV